MWEKNFVLFQSLPLFFSIIFFLLSSLRNLLLTYHPDVECLEKLFLIQVLTEAPLFTFP